MSTPGPAPARWLRAYLALQAGAQRRRVAVLAAIALAWAVAAAWVPQLPFDMSFRPLFSNDTASAAATAQAEARFGQASGAYLIAIVGHDALLSEPVLASLDVLATRVRALPHVREVISLPTVAGPVPMPDGSYAVLNLYQSAQAVGGFDAANWLPILAGNQALRGTLLSADGRRTLLLARIDLPLSDLAGRRPVIAAFEATVRAGAPAGSRVQFTGVSVVEAAYADIVLRNMLISVALTVLGIGVALRLFLGSVRAAAIALAGVAVATPVTLALMALLGQSMTIVNSMVPTMLLILGVADAIHMIEAWREHRAAGADPAAAGEAMLRDTALPCLLTIGTTAVGFASLQAASIAAIRDFGSNICLGVLVVYVLNQLLVPILLRLFDLPAAGGRGVDRVLLPALRRVGDVVGRHRGRLLLVALLATLASPWLLARLQVDQRFNEELAPGHPVRAAQQVIERDFGGFLGPELAIARRDGGSLLGDDARVRMARLRRAIAAHPDVRATRSHLDFLPEAGDASRLLAWRADSSLALQLRELIDAGGTHASLVVRTTDMGTTRARAFHDWLLATAARELGPGYEVAVVGQWWLAQEGMSHILDDLFRSLLGSGLVILPLMAWVLRRWPLFVASLVPNVLPVLAALCFMVLAGISLRIGTAMILAGSLGIAFDDSIHFMLRLRREARDKPPLAAARAAIMHTGKAVTLTTLVLLAGFASMCLSELHAIRDMGLVSMVAFAAGFVADLYLAPALYLWLGRDADRLG
jgi:predicted RND superfamily exporter protein